jgi:hypothetical protein
MVERLEIVRYTELRRRTEQDIEDWPTLVADLSGRQYFVMAVRYTIGIRNFAEATEVGGTRRLDTMVLPGQLMT